MGNGLKDCPFREGRCVGEGCALFAKFYHGATGRKLSSGCAPVILVAVMSKRWIWE